MRAWLALGYATMLGGFTVFVAGVFVTDRSLGLTVALVGLGIMLGGVALSNRGSRSDWGPGG
jgi:hypothetical protein